MTKLQRILSVFLSESLRFRRSVGGRWFYARPIPIRGDRSLGRLWLHESQYECGYVYEIEDYDLAQARVYN